MEFNGKFMEFCDKTTEFHKKNHGDLQKIFKFTWKFSNSTKFEEKFIFFSWKIGNFMNNLKFCETLKISWIQRRKKFPCMQNSRKDAQNFIYLPIFSVNSDNFSIIFLQKTQKLTNFLSSSSNFRRSRSISRPALRKARSLSRCCSMKYSTNSM